jgi:hypothetical protein
MFQFPLRKRTVAILLATTAAVAACGGTAPTAATAQASAPHEQPQRRTADVMEMMGEIGALDEDEVAGTFDAAADELFACYRQGIGRVQYLGGYSLFEVRIDQNGRAASLFAKESTLGDRETEACMVEALVARTWPKPMGGYTGIASRRFDFDPSGDVRPPESWNRNDVSMVLEEHQDALSQCFVSGGGSAYIATLYVEDDGTGEAGRVLSAGVASADTSDASVLDCIARVLKSAEYPTPGSWVAKATFQL